MRRFPVLVLFFLLATTAMAQDIKKMSVAELEQYMLASRRPMVINFWGTFCKPCVEELPAILSVAGAYPGIELVLVSLDLPDYYPERLKIFVEKNKFLPATHVWLNETDADVFCPRIDKSWSGAIPVTLFVNMSANYRQFIDRPMTVADIRASYLALDATTH